MKRNLITLAALLVASFFYGQGIEDALRYSKVQTTGTARFASLGGAFGALGGDLSAIGINPASGAVFKSTTAGLTLGIDNVSNNTTFFGSSTNTDEADLNLNQGGAVFVFNGNPESDSKWKKFTIGINYDQTANFDDNYIARGTGNRSISQFFLDSADGIPLDLLQLQEGESIADLYQFLGETEGVAAQNAFLGFQSFIIDPVNFDDGNTIDFVSNIAGNSFDQELNFASRGFNGKVAFNIAGQYGENFFIGANFNSHFFNYNQSTVFFENNSNPNSLVQSVRFENELRTQGTGFSAQIGAIYKAGKYVRLGLTYDSPTIFQIFEESSQRIQTISEDEDGVFNTAVDPNSINIFEDFTLQTPSRLAASAAILFGKRGLLNIDYAYTDYNNIRFRPRSIDFFDAQNQEIETLLNGASTYRIGGEYRVNNEWSLRGGWRFEQSPFSNDQTVEDGTGFSAGFGYSWGYFKLDFAYDYFIQERQQQLFSTGISTPATIDAERSSFITSITFVLN